MPMLRLAETMTLGGAALLSNPFFVKLGLIGLFLNSLLSSVIPIPTELTTSGLLLAGQSKTIVFTILAIGSIIGGFIAYYIGYGGIRFLNRLRKRPNKKGEYRSASLLKKYGWIILFISPWRPTKYNFRLFSIAIVSGKVVEGVAIVFSGSLILPLIFPSSLHHP